MKPKVVLDLALLLLVASPAAADWVTLKDGTSLRGIDFKKKEGGYVFTLDDGKTIYLKADLFESFKESPPGETVEFHGKQVPLREMIQALREEERQREEEVLRDLKLWAAGRGKSKVKEADAARDRFLALSELDRERYLGLALSKSKAREVRLLAAEEIAKHRTSHAVKSLALTAMTDRYRSVRDCCLTSLKTIDDPETPENFVPFLRSKSPEERVNAANALSIFPSRKAVPELIETLHLTWAGFGGGFIFQGEQRAYVGDYELVSGGTGFSIVEVADPVIQTSTTGVALDADVRRVEMYARLRTMKKITGQEFGADVEKWREWWKKNQDSE